MWARLIFTVILSILFLFPGGAASENRETLGDEQPRENLPQDFALIDAEGNTLFSLSRIGGQPAVLWFWSIYDDSCDDGMLALQGIQERFGEENLLVMAINEDTQAGTDRIRRFLERFEKFRGKIPYPILFDQKQEILQTFGISRSPALVLVDREGRIAGHFPGLSPKGAGELTKSIEGMLGGGEGGEEGEMKEADPGETIIVTGKSALCGFFQSGVWRKGFTGNNDIFVELDMARDLARRDGSRKAIVSALEMLGISLFSKNMEDVCVDERGIHLSLDPLETEDPLGRLIGRIPYSEFFQTVSVEERILDNAVYLTRTERVLLEPFASFLQNLGYTKEPVRIRLHYVNLDPMDQMDFFSALLHQSMFISSFEDLVRTRGSISQMLQVHTSAQNLAREIAQMEFGDLQVFVEEVRPGSMDIEIWK